MRALAGSTLNARLYLAFNFLLSLYIGIANVIFNLYLIRLGFGEQYIGLLISASLVATGLFAFPAAQCCDRLGSKACLIVSGLLTAISLVLIYTVTSSGLLLGLSVLNGIFVTIPTVIGSPFLAENTLARDRLHLFSANFGIFIAGSVIGTALGGQLPHLCTQLLGLPAGGVDAYRYTLMISLAMAAASVVPLVFIAERRGSCPAYTFSDFFGRLARSGTVRQLVLVSCLIGAGAGLIVPFFNVYFNKILQATPGQVGLIFSVAQASLVLGAVGVPYLTGRIGRVKTVSLTYLLSIPFLLLLAVTDNLYLAGTAYVIRMLFMNISVPISNTFSMEVVDSRDMASVSSLTSTGNNFAIAAGSLVAGLLLARGAYTLPYLAAGGFYTLAAALFFIFFRRHEAAAPEHAEAAAQ